MRKSGVCVSAQIVRKSGGLVLYSIEGKKFLSFFQPAKQNDFFSGGSGKSPEIVASRDILTFDGVTDVSLIDLIVRSLSIMQPRQSDP